MLPSLQLVLFLHAMQPGRKWLTPEHHLQSPACFFLHWARYWGEPGQLYNCLPNGRPESYFEMLDRFCFPHSPYRLRMTIGIWDSAALQELIAARIPSTCFLKVQALKISVHSKATTVDSRQNCLEPFQSSVDSLVSVFFRVASEPQVI